MNTHDFYDLLSIDSTTWSHEIDPIGLLAYQAHKRHLAVVESVELLDEALTPQQRMRRKLIMRRLAPRLARARKLAMKRRGGNDVLKRRARNLARSIMSKKLLGGRNKADVSPSERARIEKILATRKKGVERLATRLVSVVRQKQAMRFAQKQVKPHAVKKPTAPPIKKPEVNKPKTAAVPPKPVTSQ